MAEILEYILSHFLCRKSKNVVGGLFVWIPNATP